MPRGRRPPLSQEHASIVHELIVKKGLTPDKLQKALDITKPQIKSVTKRNNPPKTKKETPKKPNPYNSQTKPRRKSRIIYNPSTQLSNRVTEIARKRINQLKQKGYRVNVEVIAQEIIRSKSNPNGINISYNEALSAVFAAFKK